MVRFSANSPPRRRRAAPTRAAAAALLPGTAATTGLLTPLGQDVPGGQPVIEAHLP